MEKSELSGKYKAGCGPPLTMNRTLLFPFALGIVGRQFKKYVGLGSVRLRTGKLDVTKTPQFRQVS
jgi:hypothetical protein